MSWREVVIILGFIGGCLTAASMNKENLAMVLAGAAAGFATQNRGQDKQLEQRKATA